MSGFSRTEIICGHDVEIYYADGEEYVAVIDDFPNLDIRADTIEELREEIAVHLSVERELDKIWHAEGVPVEYDD